MKKAPGLGFRSGVLTICAVLLTGVFSPAKARADFFYHFDDVFSGTAPSASGAWMNAYFTDVSPGTVLLSVTNIGLSTDEFVSGLYINLKPTLNVADLTLTLVSSSGNFTLPTISQATDSFKADGDGKYDILFGFGTAGAGRFEDNEYFTYQITGIAGLTALDFNYLSQPAGGHGPFYAAAHVQGICYGEGSGWIEPSAGLMPVPEPSTGILAALGLGLWGGIRWFRRRQVA